MASKLIGVGLPERPRRLSELILDPSERMSEQYSVIDVLYRVTKSP